MLISSNAFFSIQELVGILASIVSRKDLYTCIQVSTSWYKLFLPYLWESFSSQNKRWMWALNTIKGKSIGNCDTDWYRNVFKKHSQYIKDLSTTFDFLLKIVVEQSDDFSLLPLQIHSSPNLADNLRLVSLTLTTSFGGHRLVVDHHQHEIANLQEDENDNNPRVDRCWKFLCSQKCLKSLIIRQGISQLEDRILRRLILNNPDSLPSLESLQLNISCDNVQFPTNIQEFSGSVSPDSMTFFSSSSSLRKIRLDSIIPLATFQNLSQCAPGLNELCVYGINTKDSESITPSEVSQSQIEVLKYISTEEEQYGQLSSIAHLFPNIIKFTGGNLTVPLSKSIAKNWERIQKIYIITEEEDVILKTRRGTIDYISPLLSGCQRLKVLDAKHFKIHAENIRTHPWICNDLEELHCLILGVPYLEQFELPELEDILIKEKNGESLQEHEAEVVTHWKHIRDLKQRIFKQISMMKSLKRLTIHSDSRQINVAYRFNLAESSAAHYISRVDGYQYRRYGSPPRDTLTMRLDDGLDQLATLTELEVFGFEFMDHQMENEDIEWIATNLPNLKEMKGLVDGAYIGIEPNHKNGELRELMKRLRPDIIHSRGRQIKI